MSWLSLAGLGLSLFQGLRGYQQQKSAGQAGYQQGMFNAQQAGYFGQLNSQAHMDAAHINAGLTMELAGLNAEYIERAGLRNLHMYGIQSDEELRRHIYAEKMSAGNIRAMQSGTGIQVNTGANLRYLDAQIREGLNQREFMMVRHAETKKSIKMDFMDRAYVTRKSGELQASAIMANGEIAANSALAQSQWQSQQYMMQAQQAQQYGDQAGSQFLWGSLGSIGGWMISPQGGDMMPDIMSMFSQSRAAPSTPPLLTSASTSSPPTLITAPGQSGAPIPYKTPVYTNRWASNFLTGVL